MVKKLFLFLFIIVVSNQAFAQLRSSLWLMGYDCCFPNFSGIDLDFRSGSLQINSVNRPMSFSETNGIMCDESGNLQFYSNGVYISNAINDTMLNGSGLNPSDFTTGHTQLGLTIPQANLILPYPEDTTRYYLFHETSDDRFATYATFYLYYSVIDLTLDNGLGAVTLKNQILLNDSLIEGRLTAVRHANGRDWWLVCHKFWSSIMYKFLVTPQGISGPFVQDLVTWRDTYFGQALFSVNGDKFAYYEPFGDLDIWDFDRCTGNFSNLIHVDINDSAAGGGAAFSPSGRFLYVSSMNYIYQFDMNAPDVAASQTTVGVYDNFLSGNSVANFYLSALAPDGKIYINCGNSTLDIHVINYPDSAGLACDFCQHCVHLPAYNAFTIPNFPNYYLGAETGSVCDTLTTIVNYVSAENEVQVFPNPAEDIFYVSLPSNEQLVSVFITDVAGREIPFTFKRLERYAEINSSAFAQGMYSVNIVTNNRMISRKVVKR